MSSAWLIAVGVLMVVLGALAIILPPIAAIATTLVIGVILLLSGLLQLIHSFQGWGVTTSGWTVATALIRVGAGLLIVYRPMVGSYALTVILATYFLVAGALKIASAVELRRIASWGWLLFDGIVSVVLGALVWSGLPMTALWVVGLFVGIELTAAGIATIAFATARPGLPRA